MKRKLSSAIVLVLIAVAARAQFAVPEPVHRSSLTVSLGGGLPLGDFAKDDFSDGAGNAKLGGLGQIMFTHKIAYRYRLAALISGHSNGVDLSKANLEPGVSVHTTPWKSTSYMVGVIEEYGFSAHPSIALNIRLFLGAQRTQSPQMRVAYSSPEGYFSATQASYSATSAEVLVGGAFIWKFKESVGLQFHIDGRRSKPKFKGVDNGDGTFSDFEQDILTVDAGAGLVFSF